MIKKTFLAIGCMSIVTLPIGITVSCSNEKENQTVTQSIDLGTMTQQQAQEWVAQYQAYKTVFNINIHMIITETTSSGTQTLYDVMWVKGEDRAHSNYGRGMDIDVWGPGDEFYSLYGRIASVANPTP